MDFDELLEDLEKVSAHNLTQPPVLSTRASLVARSVDLMRSSRNAGEVDRTIVNISNVALATRDRQLPCLSVPNRLAPTLIQLTRGSPRSVLCTVGEFQDMLSKKKTKNITTCPLDGHWNPAQSIFVFFRLRLLCGGFRWPYGWLRPGRDYGWSLRAETHFSWLERDRACLVYLLK